MGQREELHFVQPRVLYDRGILPGLHCRGCFHMTDQRAAIDTGDLFPRVPQMVPQPCSLLMAKRAQAVIAGLVARFGLGLTMAHKGDL